MIHPDNQSPISLAFAGMLALIVAMGIGRFVYTPILPMMVEEVGLTTYEAGMIASSNFAGYLFGAILAATSLLKGSHRLWMFAALIASAVTTLIMGWAQSYWQFIVLRFFAGLFSAWVLVFASTLIIDRLVLLGKRQLSALHFAGVGAGIIVASLLTTLAAISADGWRSAWLFNGVIALLITLLVIYLLKDAAAITNSRRVDGLKNHQPIKFLLIAYGLFGFGYVITATFIIQLVRSFNYSLVVESWVWILVGLAAIPSVWVWNKVASRLGNSRAFACACVCEAFGVAASVLIQNLAGLIISGLLLGGTFMGITALGLIEARSRSPHQPGRALALMTAAFGVGQIVGPVVAGYMFDSSGSFLMPTLLACAALIAASIFVQLRG